MEGIHLILEWWIKGIPQPKYYVRETLKTEKKRRNKFLKDAQKYAYTKTKGFHRSLPREHPFGYWLRKRDGKR
jgi:hypothetical protein